MSQFPFLPEVGGHEAERSILGIALRVFVKQFMTFDDFATSPPFEM